MSYSDRQLLWKNLLSSSRLGGKRQTNPPLPGRTEFDRDYDRIAFSAPFRRLQDKTQVFPLSPSDYTRTRLTHSIEVSCVGRSLGQMAGGYLHELNLLPEGVTPFDTGFIVAAACLAHDLGNPPFGHSGEDAIRQWASRQINEKFSSEHFDEAKREDFLSFEGNAQSFRIVAKVQGREREGGLRLTYATLGTLLKYPRPSWIKEDLAKELGDDVAFKKFNYFQSESKFAVEIGKVTGVPKRAEGIYARHPFALLMEAADDICYAIVDLEDAYRLKIITYEKLRELLIPLCPREYDLPDNTLEEDTAIVVLRSYAISGMTQSCINVWKEGIFSIEKGEFAKSLIQSSDVYQYYKALKEVAFTKVYNDQRVLLVEYAGYATLGGLLDFFYSAISSHEPGRHDRKLLRIMPLSSLRFGEKSCESPEEYLDLLSPYERLLCVTDYVSGLTDGAAIDLYQKLSGIKLPR